MKTALVTGIDGFTGRYLADRLREQGYRVVGLSSKASDAAGSIHRADLLDRDRLQQVVADVRPDKVVHLAAIAFVAHGDVDAVYRTNIVGTRNLLEALAKTDATPESVLIASSANVYGNAAVDPIDETTPLNPANDYAVSKMAMERMAWLWADRLPVTIVRPFNYTGVGQSDRFLLPKIVGHFRRREPEMELGNLDVARDFSDVRFVVEAYARLLEAGVEGQVFNVCSGKATRLDEVLDLMADLAGYRIDVRVNPAFQRVNEVKTLRGDGGRLTEAVGEIERIPLRSTLQWMLEAR